MGFNSVFKGLMFSFVCDWHILDWWIFIYTQYAFMIHQVSKSKIKSVQKWQEYTHMPWIARINPKLRSPWWLRWNTVEDKLLKNNKISHCCHCKRVIKSLDVVIVTETNAMHMSSWKVGIPSAAWCNYLQLWSPNIYCRISWALFGGNCVSPHARKLFLEESI